jgi:hypothetical protein
MPVLRVFMPVLWVFMPAFRVLTPVPLPGNRAG